MPRERVLVIEDEPSMRRVLEDCLTRHGYRVVSANDGEDGLRRAVEEEPDLILLDVMMPKLDGFALCAELRRMGIGVPVLFLSAKAAVDDRVRGLDHGGDDYLSKPFSQSELLARVRALLRRGQASEEVLARLELGDSEIDFGRRIATRQGKPVALSRKEFGIMRLLAQRRGKVVSREEFLDLVWGYAAFPTTRTVDRHIVGLRQKFEPIPEKPRYIVTAHGAGYRLDLDSVLE